MIPITPWFDSTNNGAQLYLKETVKMPSILAEGEIVEFPKTDTNKA